ncbi:alpha/beta-hydrolase [Dentipellis sp. KUC8613]|nr:alpha/beta-hydrolase [Dentipellis sp. KUC8613]
MSTRALLGLFVCFLTLPRYVWANTATGPTVKLDNGSFVGQVSKGTNMFLGIPFAKPPVGDLRFRLPVPNDPYNGTRSATEYGNMCPQQDANATLPDLPLATLAVLAIEAVGFDDTSESEDCLTLNVVTPLGTTASSKLPVLAFIFGGAFEVGGTNTPQEDGTVIVERSVVLGEPIIFVSLNYRLNAFGFLASKEVKAAGVGNIGLHDQRLALRWVQKYIGSFGGDPSKVVIWGPSAGAISVALQMVTNGGNTEGLFRGAVMESGSPIPVGDISHGQKYYDALVQQTDCVSNIDTLECLRHVPYEKLKPLVDQSVSANSFQSLNLAWMPRADGVFLKDSMQKLVLEGSVAKIPMINGDADDEGTIFSLYNSNLTTDNEVREYLHQNYLPDASSAEVEQVLKLYPADPASGSPFGTGDANAFTPEFKRLAAFQGDLVFQAPRRFFLQHQSGKQSIWSYLCKRQKGIPVIGSFHGSEIPSFWGPGDMTDYLIRFVTHLDPNGNTSFRWPQYSASSPQLLTLWDGLFPLNITQDTYRAEALSYLTSLSLKYPL